ncbi:15297_t:CDS:1, partial [Acaulospora morrowiae]
LTNSSLCKSSNFGINSLNFVELGVLLSYDVIEDENNLFNEFDVTGRLTW